MSNDDDGFKEELVDILVNGIDLHFLRFADLAQVEDFGEGLVRHLSEDDRLEGLEFWFEDYVVMHYDEEGEQSTFGVLITGSQILFRTENGSIDNHKNAGRILMSTIAFVGYKLEEAERLGYIERVEEEESSSEEIESAPAVEEESESESDFWI